MPGRTHRPRAVTSHSRHGLGAAMCLVPHDRGPRPRAGAGGNRGVCRAGRDESSTVGRGNAMNRRGSRSTSRGRGTGGEEPSRMTRGAQDDRDAPGAGKRGQDGRPDRNLRAEGRSQRTLAEQTATRRARPETSPGGAMGATARQRASQDRGRSRGRQDRYEPS